MNEYLIIGKIGGAHGVRGEMRVSPITDDVRRFRALSDCVILTPAEKLLRTARISEKRVTGDTVLVTFEGVSDRDEAQKLTGFYLAVKRGDAPPLEKGRYYIADMIGCTVADQTIGVIGRISEILQTGSNDVIVVKRPEKQDLLIPFLKDVVTDVDVFAQKVTVKLPDGLLEVYGA
jgi:16S rRNA processing protein RimM